MYQHLHAVQSRRRPVYSFSGRLLLSLMITQMLADARSRKHSSYVSLSSTSLCSPLQAIPMQSMHPAKRLLTLALPPSRASVALAIPTSCLVIVRMPRRSEHSSKKTTCTRRSSQLAASSVQPDVEPHRKVQESFECLMGAQEGHWAHALMQIKSGDHTSGFTSWMTLRTSSQDSMLT